MSEEKMEDVILDKMPGADTPEGVDEPSISLDFSEEPKAEVEPQPEPEPEPTPEPEPVEAEATEEVEAKAEPESEPEPEPTPEKKSPMIPKSRLDEALQKQRALQKQLDQLTQQQPVAATEPEKYDFEAKEIQYQDLLLDGETKKAADLRLEINTNMMKSVAWDLQQQTAQSIDQRINEDTELTALQQKAEQFAELYPELNENSDKLNQDYLDEVIEMRDAFIGRGFEPVVALEKSVNYVAKANNLGEIQTNSMANQKPQDEVAKKRAQVQKKLDVANSQPPEMSGESSASRGEKTINPATLTDEEFAALPETTLARLRVDLL